MDTRQYKYLVRTISLLVLLVIQDHNLAAQQWVPYSGENNLRALFSNTVVTWGKKLRGEYCSDGTGTVFAYVTTFPRTWTVKNSEQVCINEPGEEEVCYVFEQNQLEPNKFRVTSTDNNERAVVIFLEEAPKSCGTFENSSSLIFPWEPISESSELRNLFENSLVEWTGGSGEYCADGTGVTYAYGTSFPRTWSITADKFCVVSELDNVCYTVERHQSNTEQYRIKDLNTNEYILIEVSHKTRSCP